MTHPGCPHALDPYASLSVSHLPDPVRKGCLSGVVLNVVAMLHTIIKLILERSFSLNVFSHLNIYCFNFSSLCTVTMSRLSTNVCKFCKFILKNFFSRGKLPWTSFNLRVK